MAAAARAPLEWGSVDRTAFLSDSSLCYRLDWGGGSMSAIRPITGMPAQHPLVNGDIVCPGYTYNAGDPIPVNGRWRDNGNCNQFSNANAVVPGMEMFYALGHPIRSSANTGYYRRDGIMLYMVEDEGGGMHLVLTLDDTESRSGDTTGGRFTFDVSTSPPQAIGLELLDDASEYDRYDTVDPAQRSRYPRWDAAIGQGSFHWRWGPCCTDGMVLGPMPASGFQMDFSSDQSRLDSTDRNSGIDSLSLANWDPDTNDIAFVDIPISDAFSHPFSIGAFTCNEASTSATAPPPAAATSPLPRLHHRLVTPP